jgi:hypothetical protein
VIHLRGSQWRSEIRKNAVIPQFRLICRDQAPEVRDESAGIKGVTPMHGEGFAGKSDF